MCNVECPSHVSFTPRRSIIRAPLALAYTPFTPSSRERVYILETHLLQIQCSQRGPAATSTIENNFAILVSSHLIDIALEHAARDVLRSGNRSPLIFVRFANINKIEILLCLLHLFQRWDI